MTVMFDRSITTITEVIGILITITTALAPTQPLANTCSFACAVEPNSPSVSHAVYCLNLKAKTEQDNREGIESSSKKAPSSLASITRIQVLGYYPGYAAYHFPVDHIPYDKLTHISYFSLMPLANGDLDISEVDATDLEELVARADANDVETLITVGGWGRSTYFANMAASARARANFATKLLQYCLDYSLDGADLDWEPVSTVRDGINYSLLVERVHEEFEPFGLSLSVSVSSYGQEIVPEAIDFVDSLNVMAYDGTPPHHSTFDFAVSALDHWEDYGAPREKLMLGLPFYGKSENGTGYAYHDIFDAYHPGPNTDFIGGIGFNGINTIKDKTAYAVNNGYRGIMIWEISQDSIDGSSLLTAIADAITSRLPADLDGNGRIDLNDFQIFASAWQSDSNDDNWNPLCDIFQPLDNVVDVRDLAAFCRDWLVSRQIAFPPDGARERVFTNDDSDASQQTDRVIMMSNKHAY